MDANEIEGEDVVVLVVDFWEVWVDPDKLGVAGLLEQALNDFFARVIMMLNDTCLGEGEGVLLMCASSGVFVIVLDGTGVSAGFPLPRVTLHR